MCSGLTCVAALDLSSQRCARGYRPSVFDGNNESDEISIARFLVEEMGRYPRFKGRDLNSHCETIKGYREVLSAFDRITPASAVEGLSIDQVIEILLARRG